MIKRPPGPKGLPFIGSFIEFQKDRLCFLKRVADEYGDFAYFNFGPRKIYFINNPEFIKDIVITNNRKFIKSKVLQRSKIIVGEGLLTSEKEVHLNNRRAIQPLFHNKAIPSYAKIMVEETKNFIDMWNPDSVFDFHHEMMKITQTIVVKTLFGTDLGEKTHELINSLNFIMSMFPKLIMPFSELLDYLPIPSMKRLRKEMNFIDQVIYRLIDERKKIKNDNNDLLNVLLNTKDGDGNDFFTKQQIRDEIITFFIAGQETTSNSLCWTWYLLSQNPKIEEKFYEKVDTVLEGKLPGIQDIQSLKLLENIFKEGLRMFPPAWIISRRATEDYEVNGYIIPTGSDIYMSQYIVHHDDRFYDEPYKFNPDRWNEEKEDFPRFAFFPFGGGTRRCIGEPFAYMEAVLILAVISQRWKLELQPNFKVEMEPLITIRPKNGMNMIARKRAN